MVADQDASWQLSRIHDVDGSYQSIALPTARPFLYVPWVNPSPVRSQLIYVEGLIACLGHSGMSGEGAREDGS